MRGYTLIELLVTITIVVLLSGTSIAAYLSYNENRLLDTDARNLNSLLNKVRSKARFLEYPSGCTGLVNFTLSTDLDSEGERKILKYVANCTTGTSEFVSEPVLKSSVFLADFNLVIAPQTGNLEPFTDVDITIKSTKATQKTIKIVVSKLMGNLNIINNEE